MMKKFVTIVLRGLVSLSKESPIWAKEHHRPVKKDTRKKRRAARRSKAMGRRSLVRAVGISPLVHLLADCCLRCFGPVVQSHDQQVLFTGSNGLSGVDSARRSVNDHFTTVARLRTVTRTPIFQRICTQLCPFLIR